MIKRVKSMLSKVSKMIKDENCYDEREAEGIAVFGMCYAGENYNEQCLECPYYANSLDFRKDKNHGETNTRSDECN